MDVPADVPRSRAWHKVWDRRPPEKLPFDGYESAVQDEQALARLRNAQADFVAKTLELKTKDRLLDLGCGTGALTALLAPHVEHVTAVDYSSDAACLARERLAGFGDRAEVVQADLGSLDLSKHKCDKAVAVGSLHYLDSYEELSRILRTLTDGGATTLAVDLPDLAYEGQVRRDYDQKRWSHLYVDPGRLLEDFPGSVVHRGMFTEYENDRFRFSVLVRSSSPQDCGLSCNG